MKWYRSLPLAAAALAFAACNADRTTEPGPDPSGLRPSLGNTSVNGAAFTTVNETVDGTGHCKNGNPNNNCNIYDGKQYVWLNGGPLAASLSNGDYVFAVLAPGGQGGGFNPNDGTPKNLSDLSPTTNTGAGDAWTHRVFSVSNGTISYSGPNATHDFSDNKIRLLPYDDTPNNGGVYIMAICSLADRDLSAANPPGVDPSDCKYDAFKIQAGAGTPEAAVPTVEKDAVGKYTKTYAWNIVKNASPTSVNAAGPNVNITYTVTVSRNTAGDQIGSVTVTGTITVGNNNPANITGVVITDQLSNSTACSITGVTIPITLVSVPQTIGPGDNTFDYSCSLTALPASALNNTVTIAWSSQSVGGLALTGGTASFTFQNIQFTEDVANATNATVHVTDAFNGGSPVAIGTLLSPPGVSTVTLAEAPKTFTYIRSIAVTPARCVSYPNTATITETGQYSNASVMVCGLIGNGFTLGFWSNKNGRTVLCNNDLAWRYLLNGGNPSNAFLRNGDGTFYTVPTTGTCTNAHGNFSPWLLNATATNMSYMLSAQLAATMLDVAYKNMPGGAYVAHPLTGNPATINSIIAEAITFLRANGNTTASGTLRNQAQAYKNLFDGLNNNTVFAVPGP